MTIHPSCLRGSRFRCLILTSLFLAVSVYSQVPPEWPTSYPEWWYEQGLVDVGKLDTPQNYSPLNQGQLLWMADRAIEELNEQLSDLKDELKVNGTATGFTVDDMRDPQKTPSFYAPVAVGQLKFVSSKFFTRFSELGYGPGDPGWPVSLVLDAGAGDNSPNFPWLNDQAPDNFAPVNIGQAKYLFSWDIRPWLQSVGPTVDAGQDDTILTLAYQLSGSASDPDSAPSALVTTWSKVSGPDTVSFDDANSVSATATFGTEGEYVLKLTADDGFFQVSDEVDITIQLDSDGDGIPDYIEAEWATLLTNDPDFVALANSAYYDPDGIVTGNGDLLPIEPIDTTGLSSVQWDYDGDGISNYQEYLDGTDPADFFNGDAATLYVFVGDGQKIAPETFIDKRLHVLVRNSAGDFIQNAPVRFDAVGGGYLAPWKDDTLLTATRYTRTDYYGASTVYYSPGNIGTTNVTATLPLPNSASVAFTLHTVDADSAAKPSISNSTFTDNGDGTRTYTWVSEAKEGDWFQIERRQTDGSWAPVYQTTYGSTALPFVSGQNSYSLTLDENNQPVL